jgi:hypothetical protein
MRVSIYVDLLNILVNMKRIFALVFILVAFIGFGQDLKKITKTFKTPDGWSGELVKDTTYVPMFGKKAIAMWKFECKKKKLQPVEFYIFEFNHEDSARMENKAMMYYATSNCLVSSNEDIRQNSLNFIRENYYFAEKMCPCYTTGSMECRTMVRSINEWINNKDKSKEF